VSQLVTPSSTHSTVVSGSRDSRSFGHIVCGGWGMASRAEQYRERAADCERRAKPATDRGVRLAYRDVAMRWLEMASQAQRLEAEQGRALPAAEPNLHLKLRWQLELTTALARHIAIATAAVNSPEKAESSARHEQEAA
jgi:hypothetical protein